MSSSECQAMIDKYQGIKAKILGLFDYLSECSSSIIECEPYLNEVNIDGEPIDKGKLGELSSTINGFKDAFSTIVAECESLIQKYTAMKAEALRREAEAAKKKPTVQVGAKD